MAGDRWLYTPEICDGHECIADCDRCGYREEIFEAEDTMNDYISRQEAVDALASIIKFKAYDGSKKIAEYPARKAAKEFFANIPAADVVEVVRCKDCKHYVLHTLFGHSQGWCERLCDEFDKSLAHGTKEDDYCSHGERLEE